MVFSKARRLRGIFGMRKINSIVTQRNAKLNSSDLLGGAVVSLQKFLHSRYPPDVRDFPIYTYGS